MLRFMTNNIQDTVEELKAENLQLKLDALKKSQEVMKVDFHRHMDLIIETSNEKFARIIEQTTKTNGSVARAMEKINALEREDNKRRVEEAEDNLKELKQELKLFRTLANNKWIFGLIGIALYALSINEVRALLLNLLK